MREFKYPCNSRVLEKAQKYMEESIDYTHDYSGWNKKQYKSLRITTGRFGQEWLIEFAKLNGLKIKADRTNPQTPDGFDVILCDCVCDVKTTSRDDITCQVPAHLKGKHVDYFCFLRTNTAHDHIQPLGIIPKDQYFKQATFVPEGQKIPGCNVINVFEPGTYVLEDLNLLIGFQDAISMLIDNEPLLDIKCNSNKVKTIAYSYINDQGELF